MKRKIFFITLFIIAVNLRQIPSVFARIFEEAFGLRQMAAGGFGALTATAPVEAALGVTDWRGVFFILALITLAIAAAVYFVVPEKKIASNSDSIKDQLNGIVRVFSSLTFWRIAPITVMSQTAFLAI